MKAKNSLDSINSIDIDSIATDVVACNFTKRGLHHGCSPLNFLSTFFQSNSFMDHLRESTK